MLNVVFLFLNFKFNEKLFVQQMYFNQKKIGHWFRVASLQPH